MSDQRFTVIQGGAQPLPPAKVPGELAQAMVTWLFEAAHADPLTVNDRLSAVLDLVREVQATLRSAFEEVSSAERQEDRREALKNALIRQLEDLMRRIGEESHPPSRPAP